MAKNNMEVKVRTMDLKEARDHLKEYRDLNKEIVYIRKVSIEYHNLSVELVGVKDKIKLIFNSEPSLFDYLGVLKGRRDESTKNVRYNMINHDWSGLLIFVKGTDSMNYYLLERIIKLLDRRRMLKKFIGHKRSQFFYYGKSLYKLNDKKDE